MNEKYGIFSCVNDFEKFRNLENSLPKKSNFSLFSIDNVNNFFTIPAALNRAINISRAKILIFVHQDVIFPENWINLVDRQIGKIEAIDPLWGVIGIIGVKKNGTFAGHIIDPHANRILGNLPCQVKTLDEVCLIIRRKSGLFFDETLGGFHFYGADICLQAETMGMKCYAIKAPLTHLSGGKFDASFREMGLKFREKWSCVDNVPAVIETTCGIFQLKDGFWFCLLALYKLYKRKLIRRLQGHHRRVYYE